MPEMNVPIIAGDAVNQFTDYEDAVPVNMIAVIRNITGASGYLYSHDGLEQIRTGDGIDRGALYNERMGRSFRVSGQSLIEITATGVNIIGSIQGNDLGSMTYSFNSLLVVAAQKAYRYDGTALIQITDPDVGKPIDGTWIDGYYCFTDGEYIYHTDLADETSIDPLKYATSEISPDPTKALGRTQDNLLVVFNRYTTEYFINQGNEQFAFTRINQKAVNAGIVATHAWCEMSGNLYILGGRKEERVSFHILGSGQTTNLSTRYVDNVLSSYSELELSSAKLEARIFERDKLVYVRLPNETLVFNQSIAEAFGISSAWSVLESNGGPWRAINGIFDPFLNQWVYGDRLDSRIGALTKLTASQYGDAVMSEFYTPLVPLESASIDELELNTVSGFVSENVNLFVSTTRDGAIHSLEWTKPVSVVQDYSYRYIVRRLGYVRKNIGFKFRALHKDKLNVSGLVIRYG